MAKKRTPSKVVKLQLKAGQANPAPPVGTALGPTGIQIADFCKQFNDATREKMGMVLPVVINIYEDRTFDFFTKEPPMTYLIKTELNLKSGSKLPHKEKVAHLTMAQLKKIAEAKIVDMNANDIERAMSIVAGSARSMGITSDLKK
jgi:large subunit ribosomal protein L11